MNIDSRDPAGGGAEILGARSRGLLRRALAAAALLAGVAAAGLAVWVALDRARFWMLLGSRPVALPFFSEDGFREVEPWMSAAEVRDRIGCPFDRSEGAWIYPRYLTPNLAGIEPGVTHFEVVFDPATGRVGSTRRLTRRPLGGWLESLERRRRDVGDLVLEGAAGAVKVLSAAGEGVTLLFCVVLDEKAEKTVAEMVAYKRRFVAERQPWLARAGLPLLYVIFPTPERAGEVRAFLASPAGRQDDAAYDPGNLGFPQARPPASRVVVYARGVLHVAPAVASGDEAEGRADQEWLIERLRR